MSKKSKGKRGEKLVHDELRKLPYDKYITLNDLNLRYEHLTTQIDHVVLSPYGLFVIETKNMSGTLTVRTGMSEWEYVPPKKKRAIKVPNPYRQNHYHIELLSRITGVDSRKIYNIPVFVDKSLGIVSTEGVKVLWYDELLAYICLFITPKLDWKELESALQCIRDSLCTEEEHLSRLGVTT